MWDHSHGGSADLCTGQIEPSYAPDVNLIGATGPRPLSERCRRERSAPAGSVRLF